MKVFGFVLILVASTIQSEIDWTQVRVRPPIRGGPVQFFDNSRIVGGNEALPHSFPYQAALIIKVEKIQFFCGGSLISKKFVLTAAHCVDKAEEAQVILGAHNVTNKSETSQQTQNSSTFFVHKGWQSPLLDNDIALIELPQKATLNEYVQTIALPQFSCNPTTYKGQDAVATGWGKDKDSSKTVSSILRFVRTPVISNFRCNIFYFGAISDGNICTSGSGGKSTCSGDSGGPLVIENEQVGITSFGIVFGCEIGWPAAFTRVTSYLEWIAEHSDVEINNQECK